METNGSKTMPRVKPRELRVEYAAVSQRATVKETTSTQQILYVYCSPKLKNGLMYFWRLILFSYCVGVPVVVIMLYHENYENTTKLEDLQKEFDDHVASKQKMMAGRKKRDIDSSTYQLNADLKPLDSRAHILNLTKTNPVRRVRRNSDQMRQGSKEYQVMSNLGKQVNRTVKKLMEKFDHHQIK